MVHAARVYSVKSCETTNPKAASAPAARHTPRPLNRELILDGAIALIEEQGPATLSMRRLGAKLGVEGRATYHHFDSRDALLTTIGDRLLEPLHTLKMDQDWPVGTSPPHCATSRLSGPPPSSCSDCSPSTRPRRCDRSSGW
jgi:AcrR family transcriptional regulator